MHGDQGSASGNVQGSGKLQKILAIIVSTADEYRNGEGQTRPFATFYTCLALIQAGPPYLVRNPCHRTYWAKPVRQVRRR